MRLSEGVSASSRRAMVRLALWVILLGMTPAATGCDKLPLPIIPRTKPAPTALQTMTLSPLTPRPPLVSETPSPAATPQPSAAPVPSQTPVPTLPSEPALVGTLKVGDVPAPGHAPSGIVLLGGRIYVSNRETGNVSIIVGGAVRSVVPVGQDPSGIAADPDSGRVFVLNEGEASISVLEGAAVVDTWPLPQPPGSMTIAAGHLWVGSMFGGRVTVLSLEDGSVVGEVALSTENTILGLLSAPDGERVYATTYAGLHVIGASSRRELAAIRLDNYRAIGVSPSGELLYVGEYDYEARASTLRVLDARTLVTKLRVPLPSPPTDLVADPDRGRVYLLSGTTNRLVVLGGEDYQPLASLVVGYDPYRATLEAQSGHLYVANRQGDSVTVVDAENLSIIDTVPLAMTIKDLAVDSLSGRLYVTASSSDKVLVLDDGRLVESWEVGVYPREISVVPEQGWVALLSTADWRLSFLDEAGKPVRSYATGPDPRGLTVDVAQQLVYAGDTVVDWNLQVAHALRVPAAYSSESPPVQVVLDTRRDLLYAVAFNGIPGSNGGYIVTRWGSEGPDQSVPVPGKLSVIDLVYDEKTDRFYATHSRMGEHGLQISEAEDGRELLDLRLNRYPPAMVLNPTTWHLWLVLAPSFREGDPQDTRIVAYDVRTMRQVAEIAIDDEVEAIAVDQVNNRVYVASRDRGLIYLVQDVAVPLPVGIQTLPSPTPSPTWIPLATATQAPTPTSPPLPTPTCAVAVDPRFQAAVASATGTASLGCAQAAELGGDWAIQPFERGRMYWRGFDRTILALLDDGRYFAFADEWQDSMPTESCAIGAPTGLWQPIRGFGLVWCRETAVREALGWASEPERALAGAYQPFARGDLLLEPEGRVATLRPDGVWERLSP